MLLPHEKRAVAVHEAGHALVAALCEHADPVAKVTILPAGQALGVTEQLPVDDRHLFSEGYMLDSLAVRLGGRAAELLAYGEGSTGAANDLAGATQLATRMVREFGLSPELGPVGYPSGGAMFLDGGQEVHSRPYAEATQRVVDAEVARLLREAEQRARELLGEHRDKLDRLTALLLEHETIDGDTVYELAGRPLPKGHLEAVVAGSGDATMDLGRRRNGDDGQGPGPPPETGAVPAGTPLPAARPDSPLGNTDPRGERS